MDTARADRLGVLGRSPSPTPKLDEMAASGLCFARAYAHSGWTLASFSSLFSGQLPHVHRVGRSPTDPDRYGRLPDTTVTLAEALRDAGYATGAVMNNTFLAPALGLHQGFDHYDWQGADNATHRTAEATVDAALSWLDEQTGPSFLVVHIMEPHLDYAPPEWARKLHPAPESAVPAVVSEPALSTAIQAGTITTEGADLQAILALYDAEVRTADRAIGRLREALAGRPRPRLLAVTADHGEEFWDHGGFEHGHSLYGELVRVPLLLEGPGVAVAQVDTVVQHIDLFATLLAVGGAQTPAGSGGVDLRAVAAADPAPARVSITENTLYGEPLLSIADDHARLIIHPTSRTAELWAIAADGSDTRRYTGADAQARADALRQTLARIRGNLQPVEPASVVTIEDSDTFDQLQALGYLDIE